MLNLLGDMGENHIKGAKYCDVHVICHNYLNFTFSTMIFIDTALTGYEKNMILYSAFIPLCRLVPLLSDFLTVAEIYGV